MFPQDKMIGSKKARKYIYLKAVTAAIETGLKHGEN